MTVAISSVVDCQPAQHSECLRVVIEDHVALDVRLDQYYTKDEIAAKLYGIFCRYFDPEVYLMVEPSAGKGAFFKLLPSGSLGYDLDPKCDGLEAADFLTVILPSDQRICVIGNPPFGRNASMAVRFFNHAALFSSVIALIVPRTFRKASIQNRLDQSFHLVCDVMLPKNAFLFRGKPYDVPTVFQIWERREVLRPVISSETEHPDFDFTTHEEADIAIQRVGARAGRVHRDFSANPSAHYFIRGQVEPIMRMLDFARVTVDVAGNPSLAKLEIISLYNDFCQTLFRGWKIH